MAKKTITITLYKSELIYDVQNKTYLTGRSRKDGTNHEIVANMQANDDDENLNQVIRSISNAYDSMRMKMSEYIVDSSTSANDILINTSGSFVVTLTMPNNYNQAANTAISSGLHQYIVNMATAEWFTITNKADASDYYTLAGTNMEQVREAINKRIRPSRTEVSGGQSAPATDDPTDGGND